MSYMYQNEKTILFNIASRSRPDKFSKLIDNIFDNVSNFRIKIIAKVDADDPALNQYLSKRASIDWKINTSKNKIDAINRDIPKEGWDIIVDVSDDFVFTKKGFDEVIRNYCGPDDCLHFPEPYATKQNKNNRNANIIIMACMGREYYNRFGYIFNPEYKSLFCDNELTDVSKILGRYKYVDEEIFYHAHPNAGYGKADKQTRYTESFWDRDKAVYLKRKAKNFDL